MNHSNIVTLDEKGRILLPKHLRKQMSAGPGTEILMIHDSDEGQLRLLPLVKERTARFKLLLPDYLGSMVKVMSIFADYKVNVIMSESRSLGKGKLLEWHLIADTSACGDRMDDLLKQLSKSPIIEKFEVD
ncbi:MAG: hypothetical protein KKA90_01805 [Nanoarchaeota archaeon]|nr:hypothetical protein [Nanoarchaeota archaeon]